jgi:hypothetical protein
MYHFNIAQTSARFAAKGATSAQLFLEGVLVSSIDMSVVSCGPVWPPDDLPPGFVPVPFFGDDLVHMALCRGEVKLTSEEGTVPILMVIPVDQDSVLTWDQLSSTQHRQDITTWHNTKQIPMTLVYGMGYCGFIKKS